MADTFSWDVIAPRRRAGYATKKPCGSVCMQHEDAGTEYLTVPAPVARMLTREKKSGEYRVDTKDDLMKLVKIITKKAAWERVTRLIERRDYAAREVTEKLEQDGFSHDVIAQTVSRSIEIGLISDERYANAYIRGKLSAGWGSERIARELQRRGIDVKELEGWPYEFFDPDDEYERAIQIAARKRVKEPNAYAKMVRFLIGRGFSYNIATRAATEALGV